MAALRNLPDPSRGGCTGYSMPYRTQAVVDYLRGDYRGAAHVKSVRRWLARIAPLHKTGGRTATVLRGEHQLLLVRYRLAYPKAVAAEIIGFIGTRSQQPCIQDMSRAEKRLGSRFQAITPYISQSLLYIVGVHKTTSISSTLTLIAFFPYRYFRN
mgnify:FL=1